MASQENKFSPYVLYLEEKLKREKEKEHEKPKSQQNKASSCKNKFHKRLSRGKARVVAVKPPGSLEKAMAAACDKFPGCVITDDFDDIPHEHLKSVLSNRVTNILVAFMFKYHDHGVYIQDKDAAETMVGFYHGAPTPHFRHDDVKPGNYICLQNPYIHNFDDGSVGLRIDDPSQVKVINIETPAI